MYNYSNKSIFSVGFLELSVKCSFFFCEDVSSSSGSSQTLLPWAKKSICFLFILLAWGFQLSSNVSCVTSRSFKKVADVDKTCDRGIKYES